MGLLDNIKTAVGKTYSWFRKGSTASTLVQTAALAYLVYRLNRSTFKDNDIDSVPNIDDGVRLQLPPASDNKIPVLYGSAFFGGVVTDAQMTNNNQTMYFCLTLSEKTGTKVSDSSGSNYTFKEIYWNDQRITFESNGYTVAYTQDRAGQIDRSLEGLVEIYCYAGGSDQPSIPNGYSNASYPAATNIMPEWQGSTHLMEDLVFAIVKVTYNREKGVTNLGNIIFEIDNDCKKPGDVLYDYMTNSLYGAGISTTEISIADIDALNTYSDTGVNYDDQGTGSQTLADRYQINGLFDTAMPVMNNIEKITSNAASWLKYDIHEGKWGVTINQQGTSQASFDDSNILGDIDVAGTGLKELYNKVKVEFPHRELRDSADFVTIEIPDADRNANEQDNTLQLTYDTINEPIQAQLLGLIELKQSRVNLVINFVTDYSYINLKAGDLIDVTNARFGFTNKVFRIITIQEQQGDDGALTMKVTALEYDANVYSEADLFRYTRTDANGIITIGSIGIPGTPAVTKYEQDSRPRVEVETTAPTGLVEAIEFWRSTDTGLSEANRSYQLIATQKPANGGVFTSGTTVTLDYDALAEDSYVFKVRGINSTTVGPFSAVSGLIQFTPVQTTDAITADTEMRDGLGNLLGALGMLELILKLDSLIGGVTGKSIWDRIKELFFGQTGIDLDEGVNAFDSVGGAVQVKDEGTTITQNATSINFTGNGVTATTDANDNVTVNVNTNLYSAGGNTRPGQSLIWDGNNFVETTPTSSSPFYEVKDKKPRYLRILEFYPPNRNNFVDSTGQFTSDKAWITGPYYVKFGISRTDDADAGFDGTKFYGALSLGSGNAYLYDSDGNLIDTKAASACTLTNNILAIPFANRNYKTDYYVLMDEGMVNYCLSDVDILKRYVSPAVTGPKELYYEIIKLSISESVTRYVDYPTAWGKVSHNNIFYQFDTPQEFGDEYDATSNNLMMWNFNTPFDTVPTPIPSNIDTAPDTPPSGSCNVVSVKFANKIYKLTKTYNYMSVNSDITERSLTNANIKTELATPNDLFDYIDNINNKIYDNDDETAPTENLDGQTNNLVFDIQSSNSDICNTDWMILRFDKPVRVGSGQIDLRLDSDDTVYGGGFSAALARVNPNNNREVIYYRLNANKVSAGANMYITAPANIVYAAEIPDCHWLHGNNAIQKSDALTFKADQLLLTSFDVTSAVETDPNKQITEPQSEIRLIFNKEITLGTGNIELKKSDGTVHQTFTVTETFTDDNINELFWITNASKTLTLNPTVDMDIDTTYYINIDSTAIRSKKCEGMYYAGLQDTTTVRFKTDPGTVAPTADFTNGSQMIQD